MRYDIQQLRGLAVISVLLYHADLLLFNSGFLGVDVFFVISGYVITKSILDAGDDFDIIIFYRKRAARILPLSLFVLAITLLISSIIMQPSDFKNEALSIFASLAFMSNVFNYLLVDYFAQETSLRPTIHFWSLSLEEQFYLFFPIVFLWRKIYKRNVIPVSLIIFVSILSFSLYLTASPNEAFYMPHMRAWQFLAGAAIMMYHYQAPNKWSKNEKKLPFIKLCLIVGLICILSYYPKLAIEYKVIAVTIATSLFMFARPTGALPKNTVAKLLNSIGSISFSLYLIHQPVFALYSYVTNQPLSSISLLVLIPIIFILSYAAYYFIEMPLRTACISNIRLQLATIGLLIVLGFITISAYIFGPPYTAGQLTKFRYDNENYSIDKTALRNESWRPLRDLARNQQYGIDGNQYDRNGWFSKHSQKINILVIGNSHSKDVFNQLLAIQLQNPIFEIGRYGVQIHEIDENFYQAPVYHLADIIVVASRYRQSDIDSLEHTLGKISETGKKIIVASSIFEFPEIGPRKLMWADNLILDYRDNYNIPEKVNRKYFDYYQKHQNTQNTTVNAINQQLQKIVTEKFPEVFYYDRTADLCSAVSKTCSIIQPDFTKNIYDYGHLTIEGAKFLELNAASKLTTAINEFLRSK